MARTITVKGVGRATVKPDQVEIRLTLTSRDKVYEKSMSMAAEQIGSLKKCLVQVGFDEGNLKTTNFDIRTVYESIRDKNQNRHRSLKERLAAEGYAHLLDDESDGDADGNRRQGGGTVQGSKAIGRMKVKGR